MFIVLMCCAGEDMELLEAFVQVFLLPVFKENIETAAYSGAHF